MRLGEEEEQPRVLKDMRGYRKGKTRRDRDNGAHKQAMDNRDARASWNNSTRGKVSVDPKSFPLHTCNGKKSQRLRKASPATSLSKGGATRSRKTLARHLG